MFKFDSGMLKNKILIISDEDTDAYEVEEFKVEKEYIDLKIKQMQEYGAEVHYHEILTEEDLVKLLSDYSPNNTIIFNWCERLNKTDGTECDVAKIYEDKGFVYTGADLNGLQLAANKHRVKELLFNVLIPVPQFLYIKKNEIEKLDLVFDKKFIIKSNNLHASMGISNENIVDSFEKYLDAARRLVIELDTDLLLEEFINGDEYTVVVWGNEKPQALPIIQIDYKNNDGSQILTTEAKFGSESEEFKYSPLRIVDGNLNKKLFDQISQLAVDTYKILNIFDYARIDFRVDGNDVYVIDANVNPYINILDESEVYMSTAKLGYNYGETILRICEYAYLRDKSTSKILK